MTESSVAYPTRYSTASSNAFGEPTNPHGKTEKGAPNGLNFDGAASDYNSSRRATARDVTAAGIGVQPGYHDIKVPDHVDWRGAYGRRKTQDFGFPGARIKPRSTFRAFKPLVDPGDWVKRSCGHFSRMDKSETRDQASRLLCQQCLRAPLPTKQPSVRQSPRRRAATDSSTSTSSHSIASDDSLGRKSRRRRHHSENIPADKCGDTFADDLGDIIDSILDEHANSLQGVINNIKHTQPNLERLRRASEDLVKRCQGGGKCMKHQAPFQSVCPICHPTSQPQAGEWLPSIPYVPPRAAEKLNVGSPGEIKPTVNDSRPSLRDNVQTVPDLIDLVNSAADDLGVDLDRRPTARDDRLFQNAPTEHTPEGSESSYHSRPRSDHENEHEEENSAEDERYAKDNQPAEDQWLQQTRRQLTELSEARTQMMDELDSIAENLGVQLQGSRDSEPPVDPVERALSKVSTLLSRRSTRLRNKSIDSVIEEIPKMIDQEPHGRRLRRIIAMFPPEEVQEWLEMAQAELPSAIDSITSVLETLPALEYFEVESESEYTDESFTPDPPQRRYTEPISELQDRIRDLERFLHNRLGSIRTNDEPQQLEEMPSSSSSESMDPRDSSPEGLPVSRISTRQPAARPQKAYPFSSPIAREPETPELEQTSESLDEAPLFDVDFEEPELPITPQLGTREPTHRVGIEPEAEFEPPTRGRTRSMAQPNRRQPVKSPSPIPEEEFEEPIISRDVTRQPIRTATEPINMLPEEEDTSKSPFMSTQRASTLPPPEDIIRRLSTGKRTEPVDETPAPPSSPSTEEEPPAPRQAMIRRQSTQPQQFFLPESSSSYSESPHPLSESDETVEEFKEKTPPLSRRPTQGILKQPTRRLTAPNMIALPPLRQPTEAASIPPSRKLPRHSTEPQNYPLPPSRRTTTKTRKYFDQLTCQDSNRL